MTNQYFNEETLVTVVDGIEVYCSDEVVRGIYGVDLPIGMGFATQRADTLEKIILINSIMLKEKHLLDAIYYHEIGHIRLNHLEKFGEYAALAASGDPQVVNSLIEIEIEADAYAIGKGFDIVAVLDYFESCGIPGVTFPERRAAIANRK